MAGDNSPAFINKTIRNALNVANLSPEDIAKAMYVEKVMAAAGASPEDIAKALLIQTTLKAKGVSSEVIAQVLNKIIAKEGSSTKVKDDIDMALKNDSISTDEISKALAMQKAFETGKIRGLKELQKMLEEGDTDTAEGLEACLTNIIESGALSADAIPKSLIFQKAMSAMGTGADNLASTMLLQKAMMEGGMAVNDVASAMSLSMSLVPPDNEAIKELKKNLAQCLGKNIDPSDIDIILAFKDALEHGDIPKEAINLMRKAMKQRRGSVDNVAETLMSSLAASGQSQESIAKAMVKALQATGASPEEIAKTMQQAMAKSGASQEEIAKAMASAMAASGASPEDIAAALKETFAKAMAADPTSAADIARSMACALAAAGASAEDIAKTMQEAMSASIGANSSPEELLEIAQTVARAMAEAGASPEEISAAMRKAISAAGNIDDPELMAELSKTMAKAMAEAGASGEEIARAMQEALSASGVPDDEIAENLIKAMAASGASAELIAKTMQSAMAKSGMSQDEIQKQVIEAMIEAGASAEEIAQTLVAQNLMNAIGVSPEDIVKQLLGDLRSGKDINEDSVKKILTNAGIEPDAYGKVLLFQKAMAASGLDPEDIAKSILLQKGWLNGYGNSPENIAKVLEDIIAELGENNGQKIAMENILNRLVSDDMNVDDVMKAILFDKALETNGASVNNIKDIVNRSIKDKNFDQAALSKAMQDLICSGGVKADAIAVTAVLQKILTALGVSPDDIAKIFIVQKAMYDAGATPQDISMVMEFALGGSGLNLDKLANSLRESIDRKLNSPDVVNIIEVAEAFQGTRIPAELISKIMLMQKAIESDISSPEQSSADLANKLKRQNANPENLATDLNELLQKNGLSTESLEKSILLQKLLLATGLNSKEMEFIFTLLNKMTESGLSPEKISGALNELLKQAGTNFKELAQVLAGALDQNKVKGDEVRMSSVIHEAITNSKASKQNEVLNQLMSKLKNGITQSDLISLLKSVLESENIKTEDLANLLMYHKVMGASSCNMDDLAKALRIQNAILRNGVPADILARTINEVLKPRKKQLLDKIKQPLLDIISSGSCQITEEDIENGLSYQKAMKSSTQADDGKVKEIFDNAMKVAGLSKEDIAKALMVQKALAASGITPEIMAQAVMFQKALAASGISPDEIAAIFNRAVDKDMTEADIANLISSIMQKKGCTKEDIDKMLALQKSLNAGVLSLGDNAGDILNGGSLDANLLHKAILMQKILSASGLSAEDLDKAFLLQNAMVEAGASADNVAACMQRTMLESGISLEHLITLMEIELKSTLAKGLRGKDVMRTLQFEKILGASGPAKRILRKINPEALRLMEATVKKKALGVSSDSSLLEAMKGALGGVLDTSALQAMQVSAAMASAGASKEEIEEMMQMILNKGGGVSDDFIDAIKEAMAEGGSPFDKLNALKAAMEEEMNSVTNALRNTFINRIPTPEEIASTCNTLAEKLSADAAARTDVKLALVDVLDEALQDVLEYEPDADMIFNYLMVSALAASADLIERNNMKPTGDELQEMARKEMIEMISRLLMEADLEGEIPKLEVYGKTIDGIKELLNFLLKDPVTGKALKRQVAFLFDFEEIEHTTVLGLTLQDIIKDAKHKLRPWELEKKRKIRGLKKAVVPNLGYSQIYCYYRVLPEHLEGPPIGLAYE